MSDLTRFLLFGAFALLLLAALQGMRLFNDKKNARLSTNFSKNYGLIFIATVGVALTVIGATDEAKTGAFTLLGTVAGYLAGAKQSAAAGDAPNDPANPNGGGADPSGPDGIETFEAIAPPSASSAQRSSSENDL